MYSIVDAWREWLVLQSTGSYNPCSAEKWSGPFDELLHLESVSFRGTEWPI